MQEIRIDVFDAAILNALQRDGAMTNAALAEVVNLSSSQCSRRRAALEAAGLIEGYSARVAPKPAGFGLRAITRVNLRGHGEAGEFIAFLLGREEVRTAHSASGDADYILDVFVRDLDAFANFIHNALLPHPQVAQVRSEIVLRTVKNEPGVPVQPDR